jgi:hypothetical protein
MRSAWAGDPDASSLGPVWDAVADAQRRGGNELAVLDALAPLMPEKLDMRSPRFARDSVALQTSSVFHAAVGNYREALREFPYAFPLTTPDLTDSFPPDGWSPKPALPALASLVAGVNIIMLNEAHHVPQHRAFAIGLLMLLREKGFRYFAAETLDANDTDLQSRGYPTDKSGGYTVEPVYGDLIRSALRLGYRVVAYEGTGALDAERREQAQASNLVERVFKQDAHAKILIYAGYAHIDKSGRALGGVVPLAARLRQMTGQDPLTIDQTVMSEHIPAQREHPIYRYLMAHAPLSQPTIFVNTQGKPWTLEPGVRDVTLFQPRSVYVDGRPTWLTIGGLRSPYRLPEMICGQVSRCLVKARYASESTNAIPVDQIEVTNDTQTLLLPAGVFILNVQDASGQTVKTLQVSRR